LISTSLLEGAPAGTAAPGVASDDGRAVNQSLSQSSSIVVSAVNRTVDGIVEKCDAGRSVLQRIDGERRG